MEGGDDNKQVMIREALNVEHSQTDQRSSTVPTDTKRCNYIDRGYAWVILLSSFMAGVLSSASFAALGVHFVEFMDYFKAEKWEITILGSLVVGGVTIG